MVATNPHRPAPPNPYRRDANAAIAQGEEFLPGRRRRLNRGRLEICNRVTAMGVVPEIWSAWEVWGEGQPDEDLIRLHDEVIARSESVSRKKVVASPIIAVQVHVQVGTDVGDAARCMLALADQINCRVFADFNSISFFADPGESLAAVTDRAQCALSPKSSAG